GGNMESGYANPSTYACPPIRDVAVALQRNPKAPAALNCLGEFMMRNHVHTDSSVVGWPERLRGTPSEVPGTDYTRLDGYMRVMADEKAPRGDRAYALYRAVNCFWPVGSNACGSQRIPLEQRRRWFRTLKLRYADTDWAKDLRYYW